MNVLILDNYDSFTWNLVHLVEQFTGAFEVHRHDAIYAGQAAAFEKVLLSPGPGLPRDAGAMPGIIAACAGRCSVLGVCLGMQGIAEHFGGRLANLPQVRHGQQGTVQVADAEEILFRGLPSAFGAGLYYSWAVEEASLPAALKVTARAATGEVMAVAHRTLDVKGVQFHPESVMTPLGKEIIGNWLGYR